MNFRTFLRTFVLHYFIIFALTVIATWFYVSIEGCHAVRYSMFWKTALFSLAADAPLAIFISKDELSPKQFVIRSAIHLAVLEIVLMSLGYVFGMWSGYGGGIAFFFTVLAVDGAVYLLNYLNAKATADEINLAIKARRAAGDSVKPSGGERDEKDDSVKERPCGGEPDGDNADNGKGKEDL